jgi:hypothetical protein
MLEFENQFALRFREVMFNVAPQEGFMLDMYCRALFMYAVALALAYVELPVTCRIEP